MDEIAPTSLHELARDMGEIAENAMYPSVIKAVQLFEIQRDVVLVLDEEHKHHGCQSSRYHVFLLCIAHRGLEACPWGD